MNYNNSNNYAPPYGMPGMSQHMHRQFFHHHQDMQRPTLLQHPQYPSHQQHYQTQQGTTQARHLQGDGRLPQSLERVLSTISRRAEELGISPADLDDHILGPSKVDPDTNESLPTDEAELPLPSAEEDTDPVEYAKPAVKIDVQTKLTRIQLKYQKKKLRAQRQKLLKRTTRPSEAKETCDKDGESKDEVCEPEEPPNAQEDLSTVVPEGGEAKEAEDVKAKDPEGGGATDEPVSIEYIQEELPLDRADPSYVHFRKVAHHFKFLTNSADLGKGTKKPARGPATVAKPRVRDRTQLEEEKEEIIDDEAGDRISKKQLKKLTRLSVAELKQLVLRPDVVEMHDVTARDPKLLVLLKSTRNTVPVPRHWSGKRKYLQGKRGFVKPPFELPDFIKRTGIMDMRQSLLDKDDHKSLKQKMRERIRPKLGKIEIDYQKLHDAFFKFQTKPRMGIHGDLYYEGKENEIKLKQKKPGHLSDELRAALGMPLGSSNDKVPPPWLIAMQRYGPPPSYPNLKILGLNAPIPEGCSFGYHAGGWGKPPVDEMGRPLYGDVFGCSSVAGGLGGVGGFDDVDFHVDKTLWGEMDSDDSENEGDSDSDEKGSDRDEGGQIVDMTVASRPQLTDSGVASSAPIGLETPTAVTAMDHIEIRKRLSASGIESEQPPPLYHVLAEKPTTSLGAAIMGSAKVYDVAAAAESGKSVDIALAPDELEMDSDMLEKRYRERVQQADRAAERRDSSSEDEGDATTRRSGRKRHGTSSSGAVGGDGTQASKRRNKHFKF